MNNARVFNGINPEILAQVTGAETPDTDLFEEPVTADRVPDYGALSLRGSAAQVKWARTIRANTLNLRMTSTVRAKLESVADASWWIANRTTLPVLKYKEPSAAQMVSTGVSEPATTASAKSAADTRSEQERVSDAEKWAHSVSQSPRLAEAAILAVLSRLYKEAGMKFALQQAARKLLAQGAEGSEKDMDAVVRMLEK